MEVGKEGGAAVGKGTMRALLAGALTGILAMGLAMADHHEEAGWESIFDGKTLAGWKSSPDNPAAFSVVDGLLKVSGKRAHLYYVGKDGKASFTDFEMKVKVKTMAKANSGIYFHTVFQDAGWPKQGYEVQVNTSHGDPKKTGSLYGVVNIWVDGEDGPAEFEQNGGLNKRREEAPSKDDEWFEYHIIVKGNLVTLKVNGKTTVEFAEPDGWKGPNKGMSGRLIGEGTFALQAHDPGSTVFYKDIRIKVSK